MQMFPLRFTSVGASFKNTLRKTIDFIFCVFLGSEKLRVNTILQGLPRPEAGPRKPRPRRGQPRRGRGKNEAEVFRIFRGRGQSEAEAEKYFRGHSLGIRGWPRIQPQ